MFCNHLFNLVSVCTGAYCPHFTDNETEVQRKCDLLRPPKEVWGGFRSSYSDFWGRAFPLLHPVFVQLSVRKRAAVIYTSSSRGHPALTGTISSAGKGCAWHWFPAYEVMTWCVENGESCRGYASDLDSFVCFLFLPGINCDLRVTFESSVLWLPEWSAGCVI